MVNLAGPWTPDMYAEHLPEAIAFDEGLIQTVYEYCQPRTSLDLGCGLGYFVRYLRERGVDAWGVEAANMGEAFKAPTFQIQHDLSVPFDLKRKFDLVICLEVVEHLPHEMEALIFNNLVRHTGQYLLFSGATPGQGGTGHINEQPESHWFAHLIDRGLRLVIDETVKARIKSQLPWYAQNASLWEVVPSSDRAKEIAERDSQLLAAHKQIQELQYQVRHTQYELAQAASETERLTIVVADLQKRLDASMNRIGELEPSIAAMKVSRLWRLRSRWVTLKQFLGLAGDA